MSNSEINLVNAIFAPEDPNTVTISCYGLVENLESRVNLPLGILNHICRKVDDNKTGRLTKSQIVTIIRLLGHAQSGKDVCDKSNYTVLLNKVAPLPVIEGIYPNITLDFPLLLAEDRLSFLEMFRQFDVHNLGRIRGEQVIEVFCSGSLLPQDQLAKIWNITDNNDRGWLDAEHFVIFMYFLNGLKSDLLPFIPFSVPPELHQQAGGFLSPSYWRKWYFYPLPHHFE